MLNNLSSVNTYYTFIFCYTLHIVFIFSSYGDFAMKIKLLLTCVRDKVIAKFKIDIYLVEGGRVSGFTIFTTVCD